MSLITIEDLKVHLRLATGPKQQFFPTRLSGVFMFPGLTGEIRIQNDGPFDVYFNFGTGDGDPEATTTAGDYNFLLQTGFAKVIELPMGSDRVAIITAPGAGVLSSDPAQSIVLVGSDTEDGLLSDKINAAEALVAAYLGSTSTDLATDLDPMPAPVLEAIRQTAGALYENREGQGMPAGVSDLLAPYRLVWSFG